MLHIQNLTVKFEQKKILRSINLDIPQQGVTAILGPSGTGKSSLMRTLTEWSDAGGKLPAWVVEGAIVTEPQNQPVKIGLVGQRPKLALASVQENLISEWPLREQLTWQEQQSRLAAFLQDYGQQGLLEKLKTNLFDLPAAQKSIVAILSKVLAGYDMLLIDEPTAEMTEEEARPVLDLVRQLGQRMAVVLVTHSIAQAKDVADRVALMASGCVQEAGDAKAFFAAPSTEVGASFLRTGSCPEMAYEESEHDHDSDAAPELFASNVSALHQADRGAAPDFSSGAMTEAFDPVAWAKSDEAKAKTEQVGPKGFNWMLKDMLAGTPLPGLLRDVNDDLQALKDAGITWLISLTEVPFDAKLAAPYGISCSAVSMPDMAAPTIEQAEKLCRFIEKKLTENEKIAVHCKGGQGRTGTVLGCYMIWQAQGMLTGKDALKVVRSVDRGWVQSIEQIEFLNQFANWVASQPGLSFTVSDKVVL